MNVLNALILYKNNIQQQIRDLMVQIHDVYALILYKNNIQHDNVYVMNKGKGALILYKNNIQLCEVPTEEKETKFSINPL